MESAKLLRSRRSSDNRKKRKKKEKVTNVKRRKSRNACLAEVAKVQSSKMQSEETCQKEPTKHANYQEDDSEHGEAQNESEGKSRNARLAEEQSSKMQSEETCQKDPTQHANCQEDDSEHGEAQKESEGKSSCNETAKRYHRHALFFYAKWKELESGILPVIEENSIND